MRLLKYFCFSFAILFMLSFNVYAEDCDSNDINHLKQLSKFVVYQYDYLGPVDLNANYQTYNIYFDNLNDDFFVTLEEGNEKIVFEKNNQIGRVQSGKKQFNVYSKKCYVSVRTLIVDLPKYNYYSNSDFCLQHKDLKVCEEWYQGLTDSEFQQIVDSYNNSSTNDGNEIIEFIKSYYYIILPLGLILIVLLVLLIKRKIENNRLE